MWLHKKVHTMKCSWNVLRKMGNFQNQNWACCINSNSKVSKKKKASSGELAPGSPAAAAQACGHGVQPSAPMSSTESSCMPLQPRHGGKTCSWQNRLTPGIPGQPVQFETVSSGSGVKPCLKNKVKSDWKSHPQPTSGLETCLQRWAYAVTHAVTHNKAEQDFTGEAQHCSGEFGHWHAKAETPVRATLMLGTSSGSLRVLFL